MCCIVLHVAFAFSFLFLFFSRFSQRAATEKAVTKRGFEYLDHTADVQLHSWGSSLEEAFEEVTKAMFGYMCELDKVECQKDVEVLVEAEGHDMQSLLFKLLDEFLYQFCVDFVVCKNIKIVELDKQNFKLKAKGYGEVYNRKKHGEGTEIKGEKKSRSRVRTNSQLLLFFSLSVCSKKSVSSS